MGIQYAGADWVASCLKRELKPFERIAADLLGVAWRGIYHLEDCNRGVSRGEWEDYRVSSKEAKALCGIQYDDGADALGFAGLKVCMQPLPCPIHGRDEQGGSDF